MSWNSSRAIDPKGVKVPAVFYMGLMEVNYFLTGIRHDRVESYPQADMSSIAVFVHESSELLAVANGLRVAGYDGRHHGRKQGLRRPWLVY